MNTRFNPGQLEAVESRADRIVVSAGAGSGKTRVLVQRFVDQVFEQERAGTASPLRSVLLITFTDKAAGELTERVRKAFLDAGRPDLAREVDGAWISTIHGFCARMVRRHALELGVDPGFAVLADPQTGLVRAQAFESAARACLASGAHGDAIAELVEEGVADLRKTVLAAYDRARSKGVPVADVRVAPCKGYADALRRLRATLGEVLPRYRQLRETATVASNLASFLQLDAALEALAEVAGVREGAAAVLALGAFKGASRGDEETKQLTREVNEALEAALQAAVDTLADERARAWLALLVAFADEYGSRKDDLGALDFEDLQLLTRRLWMERPDIASRLGSRFAEILVDEFQDTNELQLQVIGPISGNRQCVVGDVQQSIYRFRDADVGLLEGKRRSAEERDGEQACRLTVNYRSNGRLLEGLNRIFGAQDFFGSDYLTLESGADADSSVRWPEDEPRIEALIVDKKLCGEESWRAVEARALAQRLAALVAEGRMRADDIVVLARASTTMPIYIDALRRAGFSVIANAAGGFYATPEYADVRALMRVLANPLDDEGVLCLLAGGFAGLSDDALLLLSRHAKGRGLWATLRDAAEIGLSGDEAARADLVRSTLEGIRALRGRVPLADAILLAAATLGPEGGLLAKPDSWGNVRKAARLAAEFEAMNPPDPGCFLDYLDDRETFIPREAAAGAAIEGAGAVRVMTIHAAKGLEFPVVAVADLGHAQVSQAPKVLLTARGGDLVVAAAAPKSAGVKALPAGVRAAALAEEAALDLAESKRVFYVACTRAQQALILAGSTDPEKAPREGIAADWVLEAAARDGGAILDLMALSIIGPEDVPELPPVAPSVSQPDDARTAIPAPSIAAPSPIPAPTEVSYTALALHERCEYRFFAERMLRLGSLDLPKEEDPLGFGSALHAALELVARGLQVDAARLERIVSGRRLPAGSLERLVSAVAAVRASDVGPLLLQGQPEFPFAIQVPGGVVRGTMDLVVRTGTEAIVLDYKTGETWDETGARYRPQAEVYALALLEAGAGSVRVRFVHVEAGCEVAEFVFTASDREAAVARIERAFERMGSGTFAALSAYDPSLCADCPASGNLCPVVHPHAGGHARR